VYYLCRGDEVVYVGQSRNLLGRIGQHSLPSSGKQFDKVFYRRCDSESQMMQLELNEIKRLQPEYNITHKDASPITKPKCALCGRPIRFRTTYVGVALPDGTFLPLCCEDKRDCLLEWWQIQRHRKIRGEL